MNCVILYTKDIEQTNTDEWLKITPFVSKILYATACCLRLSRSVLPFLKDQKKYFTFILKVIKSNIKNPELTLQCLQIIKLLMLDEQTTQLVLSQFQSLNIFLLQIIDYNQQNISIVRTSLFLFKRILENGKINEPAVSKKILADILAGPKLRTL